MTFLKESQPHRAVKQDTVNPPALLEFMMKDWKPQSSALPKPHRHTKVFRARREALSKLFPGEVLIVPTGHEQVRANDTYFRFRAGSDFYWLTGNQEPDCVLIMVPTAHGHDAHLFVEPNPGRSNETFYTDRKKGELWVGPRFGVTQSCSYFGMNFAHALSELPAFLEERPLFRLLRGISATADTFGGTLHERPVDKELATALGELRLKKDALEVGELEKAIAATKRGFEDVIRLLPKAKTERELEAQFGLRARVEGNDVGYGTIAAAGAHACILHWTHNDGALSKKELLLLDAGVEGKTLYTADITRTLPISGKFSREQREIYELVWAAQQAALKAVKPGNDFMEPNRRAMRVLAEGLVKLGVLSVTADEALADEKQFYKRYSLHNVSHMLGLDVHDCAKARQEVYRHGPLQPGMVLTIEPGLYFQEDDLTVPKKYRGIGIRIEDDVLVTAKGFRNLSQDIPSEASAVERWMKSIHLNRGRR